MVDSVLVSDCVVSLLLWQTAHDAAPVCGLLGGSRTAALVHVCTAAPVATATNLEAANAHFTKNECIGWYRR